MPVCVTLLVTNTFCYQNDTFMKGVLPANYISKFDGFYGLFQLPDSDSYADSFSDCDSDSNG